MNGFGDFALGVSLDQLNNYDGYLGENGDIVLNEKMSLEARQGRFYGADKVDGDFASINAVFDASEPVCDVLNGYRDNHVPEGGVFASFGLTTFSNAKKYHGNFTLKVYQVEIVKPISLDPSNTTSGRMTCEYKFAGQYIQNAKVNKI